MSQTSSRRLRGRLVRDLERRGIVRSRAVGDAFLAVPRERFLPGFAEREGLASVYRDEAVPTRFDARGFPTSSSSQPAIMAEMLEQLALEPGMHVLEIGAGTGYNAALLAELVGKDGAVTAVDVDPAVAREARSALRDGAHRVRVAVADGRDGYAPRAPYDRIVVTASATQLPQAWLEQLGDGGLLVVPLRFAGSSGQAVVTFRRVGGRFVSVELVPGGFMPLRGPGADEELPPMLTVSELSGGRGTLLLQLAGEAVGRLSAPAKRRLVATALEPGRRVPLGLRPDPAALGLYLTVALPRSHGVSLFPQLAVGVIGRDGRSLAYVSRGGVTAHGGPEAEERLLALIRRWDERGRPGGRELRLVVDYRRDGGVPRLR